MKKWMVGLFSLIILFATLSLPLDEAEAAPNMLISPQYEEAGSFHDGLAWVKKNGLWGVIDKEGNEVITPQYHYHEEFSEGLVYVDSKFIDRTGKTAFTLNRPHTYGASLEQLFYGVKLLTFIDGYAYVLTTAENNPQANRLMILVDREGNEIVKPEYDSIGYFTEGLASVNKGGEIGFIDRVGQVVVEPQYMAHGHTYGFKEGLAKVYNGSFYGFIDKTGNEVIELKYSGAEDFSAGVAAVKKDGKWGYIDRTGKVIINFKYSSAHSFSEGYAVVSDHDGFKIIDQFGNEKALDARYHPSTVNSFHNGLLQVCVSNPVERCGFVDSSGKTMIEPDYIVESQFNDGLVLISSINIVQGVGRQKPIGILDQTGNVVIEPKYDQILSFREGLAAVSICESMTFFSKCKWGFIDKTGKEIIEPQYDGNKSALAGVGSFNEGIAAVNLGGKWGYIHNPLNSLPTKDETPIVNSKSASAVPTSSKILVNGKEVSFQAYNIDGNNYFKLRDLAMVLSGTEKSFEVGWDGANNAISLESGKEYTAVGGELVVSEQPSTEKGELSTSTIYLDGKEVQLTAYLINSNNYFKLRDVATVIDFGVTWDGKTNTIGIDSSMGYVAN